MQIMALFNSTDLNSQILQWSACRQSDTTADLKEKK